MPSAGLFVAFGKIAQPGEALRREGTDVAARGGALGRQVAIIQPDTAAFRLNSPGLRQKEYFRMTGKQS